MPYSVLTYGWRNTSIEAGYDLMQYSSVGWLPALAATSGSFLASIVGTQMSRAADVYLEIKYFL